MSTLHVSLPSKVGSPAWELAERFPTQGKWTEAAFFRLPDDRRIELVDGRLEFLPMPKSSHQFIALALLEALRAFTRPGKLGVTLHSGTKVRVAVDTIREPDVVFMLAENRARIGEDCWDGADLVMEVVSGSHDDRHRDLKVKRTEYARAKIAEYWIVDPEEEVITVLRLSRRKYVVHGAFGRGTQATSVLLPGFAVSVDDILDGRQE